MRVCESCGASIEHRSRAARTCDEKCKKRRQAAGKAAPAARPAEPLAVKSDVAGVVEKQLRESERLDTVNGQLALVIARRLDNGDRETGTTLAALSKQLEVTLAAALEGVGRSPVSAVPAGDSLDQFSRRREQKFAGA